MMHARRAPQVATLSSAVRHVTQKGGPFADYATDRQAPNASEI